jgi:hypothetical protein
MNLYTCHIAGINLNHMKKCNTHSLKDWLCMFMPHETWLVFGHDQHPAHTVQPWSSVLYCVALTLIHNFKKSSGTFHIFFRNIFSVKKVKILFLSLVSLLLFLVGGAKWNWNLTWHRQVNQYKFITNNSKEQNPSWEPTSLSASHEILHLPQNPEFIRAHT